MASYRVKPDTITDIRMDASANAKSLIPDGLAEGAVLKFEGEKKDDGPKKDAWIKVSFVPPAGSRILGWVAADDVEEAPDQPRPKVDPVGFARECYTTERRFNKNPLISHWVVSAELLIARAQFETAIENLGPQPRHPDGAGPLQVSEAEWKDFVAQGGDLVLDRNPESREHPTLQIGAAAWRMHMDVKAISDAMVAAGVGTAETPFMPAYRDLLHAYLLGDPKGAVAIIQAQKSDEAKDKDLKDILGWDQAKMEDLYTRQFQLPADTKLKLGAYLEAADKALAAALQGVFEFTRDHLPDELPATPAESDVVVVPVDIPGLAPIPAQPPFATAARLGNNLFWPAVTSHPDAMVVCRKEASGKLIGGSGRNFFADRNGGHRHHVGVDVYCRDGDDVVACADGTVVNYYGFYRTRTGEMSFALFVAHEGVVINYGEVKGNAPVAKGKRVKAGDKIGVVSSANMIHFETYEPGAVANTRWLAVQANPPRGLLNPTRLLLELAANAPRIFKDGRRERAVGSAQIAQPVEQGGGGPQGPRVPVNVNDDDLLTLARTIYGEARGEIPAGRAAVAHVVMNRLRIRFRGDDTVTKVCRSRLQFSCWNLNDPNRRIIEGIRPGANKVFDQCCETADQVMKGQLADNTDTATHYYSVEIPRPNWARPPAIQTTRIGTHAFFKNVR
jgi:murein DD-endopeptidase MepM/ murein hydrolase activator NlpD